MLWRVLTYFFQNIAMKPQATNNTYGLRSNFCIFLVAIPKYKQYIMSNTLTDL